LNFLRFKLNLEFPIEKGAKPKWSQNMMMMKLLNIITKFWFSKTIFRIGELPVLVFWGNNPTSKNHTRFQLLQNPQRTNGFMKEPANN
jgi:hypothetical protein